MNQLNRVNQMPNAQRERTLARAENLERLSPEERDAGGGIGAAVEELAAGSAVDDAQRISRSERCSAGSALHRAELKPVPGPVQPARAGHLVEYVARGALRAAAVSRQGTRCCSQGLSPRRGGIFVSELAGDLLRCFTLTAGDPPYTAHGSRSRVATDASPSTEPSPMFTPGATQARAANPCIGTDFHGVGEQTESRGRRSHASRHRGRSSAKEWRGSQGVPARGCRFRRHRQRRPGRRR